MYRSTSTSRILQIALLLTLVLAFAVGAATPAMALSAKHRVIKTIETIAKAHHLGAADTSALLKICRMESGYRPTATNGSCKGLFQLMTHFPKSKWANPTWNTTKAIKYIKHRYGTPRAALRFHYAHGWY